MRWLHAARIARVPPLRRLLPRHMRGLPDGPLSVSRGLATGLASVGRMVLSTSGPEAAVPQLGVVGVLSGATEAARAASWRRDGRISRLLIGPNVALLPSLSPEAGWVEADVVVVPCDWVAEMYIRDSPFLANRIAVWPSGVNTDWWRRSEPASPSSNLLIYDKDSRGRAARVRRAIHAMGIATETIRYGDYQPESFRRALSKSRAVLWLGATESQGLAMFEAWSCDVPVFVIGGPSKIHVGPLEVNAHPAPYLTPERGRLLRSLTEIPEALDAVQLGAFSPRSSIVEEFGLAARAAAYWSLAQTGPSMRPRPYGAPS